MPNTVPSDGSKTEYGNRIGLTVQKDKIHEGDRVLIIGSYGRNIGIRHFSRDDERALKAGTGARMSGGLGSNPQLRVNIPHTFSDGYISDETGPYDGARRQIAHFEALRKNCALFQRNERILGEDMLFLSAVEKADAFTAVGVELIHVVKYISVNLIAVRKICRKHDRLLMNRMLGGYYQRVRQPRM